MRTNTIRLLVLTMWAVFLGCSPQGERCRKCGMLVEDHPRWVAGMVNASGGEELFCSPRCMFAYMKSARGAGGRDAWVTEYYGQERTPIDQVFFVAGSDLSGPMGKALVPVKERGRAEQFMKDHQGTGLLMASNITVEVLKGIAGK